MESPLGLPRMIVIDNEIVDSHVNIPDDQSAGLPQCFAPAATGSRHTV